ncbi:MAG: substrate-binding domain-containing protein [Nitriliruptoraceae bacterium]
MRLTKLRRTGAILAALALVLVACGDEEADAPDGGSDEGTEDTAEEGEEGAGGDEAGEGLVAEEGTLEGYDALPFTDILPLEEQAIDEEVTIGFSQTGFNHPWRVAMLESVLAEADRHDNVRIITTDGDVDIQKQSNDIDDLLAQGVDAIVMSPVESDGLVPAADRVREAGIPLVVLDRDVFTEKDLFIGQSNVTMAETVAQRMVDDLGGEGKILEITGLVGSSPAIDRTQGMMNIIEEHPGIELITTGDGEWIREPAVDLMEDWLVRYEEIDAVFSHAEESSWGAQLAISRAGRCDEGIRHYTHDGSSAGFESVAEGQFAADGNYSPFIGDIGVRAALMLILGQEIPDGQSYDQPGAYLQLPDLPVVEPENAEEWIPKGWGDFEPQEDPCG